MTKDEHSLDQELGMVVAGKIVGKMAGIVLVEAAVDIADTD